MMILKILKFLFSREIEVSPGVFWLGGTLYENRKKPTTPPPLKLKKYQKSKMTEPQPSDTEILEFLLNQFKSYSLQMNGQHSYRFMNDGFPMNRAKGPNVRDAIIVAMREQEECVRKFKEKYPE